MLMQLRTNYGRQVQPAEPIPGTSVRTLRPAPGSYITGLYFRLGLEQIESVGLIYADCSQRKHHAGAEKGSVS